MNFRAVAGGALDQADFAPDNPSGFSRNLRKAAHSKSATLVTAESPNLSLCAIARMGDFHAADGSHTLPSGQTG
jgi:hypothetical protein